MVESGGRDGAARGDHGEPSVSPDVDGVGARTGAVADDLAPSEAFQTLASEVRVAVLVELLAAERAGETPLSFSALQAAAGHDSSAGFAYHLRQLSGAFVEGGEAGYVLTPEGRRAAEFVLEGAFTGDAGSAS
jgi:hypothetical protein